MKFQPQFTANGIKSIIADRFVRIKQAMIMRLYRVGENFITNGRLNGTYTDQTGNLRSSIGYVILRDGVQLFEKFQGDGEGVAQAKKICEEQKTKYPTGLVLICVAGMEYAAAVESKGYDVITGSSLIAITELKEGLAQLQNKASNLR